jgi:hypothetical protein
MVKSIVAILVVGFLASSCTSYSCPTYAKKAKKVEKNIILIKENI